MSQKSPITTRSKLRRMAEQMSVRRKDDVITDSGMQSERAPGSPSVAPTVASTSALNIPLTGGRIIDYSERSTAEETMRGHTTARGRHTSPRSKGSSRNSRKSVEYIKKRIEYEAERELVQLKEGLLKKRLEVDLAEVEAAAESDDSHSDAGTTQRVEQWIDTTPQVTQASAVLCQPSAVPLITDAVLCTPPRAPVDTAARQETAVTKGPNVSSLNYDSNVYCIPVVPNENKVSHAMRASTSVPLPNLTVPTTQIYTPVSVDGVRFSLPRSYPVFTTPAASVPRVSILESDTRRQRYNGEDDRERRREASGDRDRKIDRLAEAITSMARPRPVPRQAYELPHFSGDPAEWISYRNMYWDTAELYNFKAHENLARLKTSLHGEAKTSVEDLLRSGTDPSDIMRALEEEFGHPTLVLQCALKKVRDLPRVTESGHELRKMASTVRNCVSLLKNIRADGYINNPQLVSELLHKLTPIQRAQYGDFAMGIDNSQGVDLRISPNLEILSHFLIHLTRSTSYYVQASMLESNLFKPSVKKQVTGQTRPMNTARFVNNKPVPAQRVNTQSDEHTVPKECIICQREHAIEQCDEFKKLNIQQRWNTIKEKNTCFKCLIRKHPKRFCRASRCEKCGYGHHLLLHADKQYKENKEDKETKACEKVENVTNIGEWRATALLKIIPVTISDDNGNNEQCYALLDDGATVSLIDSAIASKLEGPRIPLTLKTAGGYGVTDLTSRAVQVKVTGPNGQCHNIKCRTMVNMNMPTQTVSAAMLRDNAHLRDLGCEEMRGAKPLLLLGQDNWELLVSQDIRRGKSGKPVASLTNLGWVIHGPFDNNSNDETVNCVTVSLPDLHDLVKSQFELEAIGISQNARKHKDIERALEVLDNTSHRVPDGSQWEVGLLWKHNNVQLPNNYNQARQRLYGIEKRMRKDASFAEAYTKQIDRLLQEGYARKVEGNIDSHPVWYLPHFGVVNPNKPGKLRLVFDAAAKSHGTCLNDNLLTGPDLLNSLLGILLKFRIGPIAFSGDIADMFMRIKIRLEDQGAQLFLWRGTDQSKEPDIYAMDSMIFGAASSPTTAIYILNKNASEFGLEYPEAVEAIKNKHYMDDYLDSTCSDDEANKLIEEVTRIHASGGFIIRGWVTNSSGLRDRLKADMPERVALEKGLGTAEKELGLTIAKKFYWTDSKTVLKWINSEAQEFQRFISHRLAEIDRLSDRGNWRWVPSEVNPADKATRLSWPHSHAAWLSGPSFLRDPQERWPVCREAEVVEADLERIQRVHATTAPRASLLHYERYSSWGRIQRVMARILIFIGRCRKQRTTVEIQLLDLEEAHNHLLKLCQEDSFSNERAAILKGMPVPNNSSINALDPMVTDDGLLRVRGRLSACEVLYTLLTEAELIVNSRPLSYVHDDHNQPVVLTPNHLLLGTASGSTPFTASDAEDVDSRRQWRRVNALADMFWRRWLREYLPTLQRREKWTNNVPNVRVGDVVVIVDNNKERSAWTKGLIKAVYQGNDGIIRVVDVKTVNGVLRRPVAKIAVLPTDQV